MPPVGAREEIHRQPVGQDGRGYRADLTPLRPDRTPAAGGQDRVGNRPIRGLPALRRGGAAAAHEQPSVSFVQP